MRASTLFSIIGGETAREIKKGGGGCFGRLRERRIRLVCVQLLLLPFLYALWSKPANFMSIILQQFFLKYLTIPRSLIIWKKIIAVIHITFAVAKKKKKSLKKFRLVRDSNPWPVRYQCRRRSTNLTSQDVELVRIKPVKGWWWSYEYMKIIYENCGVKNHMKEDHRR